MKKLTSFLVSLYLVMTTFFVNAQIQQGGLLVGGNIANFNLVLTAPSTFGANLTPTIAWFVHNNTALGAYGNFEVQTTKGFGADYTYGAGALTRFYAGSSLNVWNHSRFFVEATLGLSSTAGNVGSLARAQFGVGPGFAYFITPNVGLETLLKYNGFEGLNNAGYVQALTLALGLQVYLPGQHKAEKEKPAK